MAKAKPVKQPAPLAFEMNIGDILITREISKAPKNYVFSVKLKKGSGADNGIKIKGNDSGWVDELDCYTIDTPPGFPTHRHYSIKNLTVQDGDMETLARDASGNVTPLAAGKLTITVKTV